MLHFELVPVRQMDNVYEAFAHILLARNYACVSFQAGNTPCLCFRDFLEETAIIRAQT